MTAKKLKYFTLVNGELYFQGSGEVLARPVYKGKAREELQRINNLSSDNDTSLYKRL